ncbi:MAG: hypothetical protein U5J63_00525 [Fodinibius sp.]|nr:hypothetical protein [Fodinibius sp.]
MCEENKSSFEKYELGDIFGTPYSKAEGTPQILTQNIASKVAHTITIKEESYSFWRMVAGICGILCVLFFVIFWLYSDPFWTSIWRLVAFIFFAGAVMAYLKVMDGPLHVTLEATDDLLLVRYLKKGQTIQEEQFERDTIAEISNSQKSKNLFTNLLQPQSAAFRISFTDTDQQLFLFEFSGRRLLFNRSAQGDIMHYLREVGIQE